MGDYLKGRSLLFNSPQPVCCAKQCAFTWLRYRVVHNWEEEVGSYGPQLFTEDDSVDLILSKDSGMVRSVSYNGLSLGSDDLSPALADLLGCSVFLHLKPEPQRLVAPKGTQFNCLVYKKFRNNLQDPSNMRPPTDDSTKRGLDKECSLRRLEPRLYAEWPVVMV